MRFLKALLLILVLGVLVLAPVTAEAASATFFGPIFPDGSNGTPDCRCPESAPDFKCVLATVQNGINFVISVGVIIFVLIVAYAGFLLMLNPFSSENKSKARGVLLNAVIGLLVALSAWLIVDFVMKTLYNSDEFGPWNSILGDGGTMCITVTAASSPITTGGGAPTDGSGGITTAPGPTTVAAKICSEANEFRGESTTACNCGGNACAWAVNQVLRNAGIAPLGTTQVTRMEGMLRGGRGQAISQSSAVCGDLVIVTGSRTSGGNSANHVGICLNSGCTQVISNSSSRKTFSWVSPFNFTPSYINAIPRVYRVKN